MIVKGKSSEWTAKAHESERGECLTHLLAMDAINLHQQGTLAVSVAEEMPNWETVRNS